MGVDCATDMNAVGVVCAIKGILWACVFHKRSRWAWLHRSLGVVLPIYGDLRRGLSSVGVALGILECFWARPARSERGFSN